jgi:hypothetical protein
VTQDVVGARTHDSLGERRGLGQEEERVVLERRVRRHPLELVDGRHDVEHPEALHRARMIERHPVGDAPAAVVTDHGEPLEAQPHHHVHELRGHLALAEPLPQRASRRRQAVPVAAQIGHHHRPVSGEGGRDLVPAVVILRKAVEK